MLTVDLGNASGVSLVRVLNLVGEEVFREYTSASRMVMNTSALKQGIYFVSAESNGKILGREKFVVIH